MYDSVKLIHTQELPFITLDFPEISHIYISDKSSPIESHVFVYFLGIYHLVKSKKCDL